MKNVVNIFSLILAAALCAGFFSCASVPTPPPAVTDTDAAETVGVPDTTNVPETGAVTTAAGTSVSETKAAETTNVPVTTPAVTTAPVTTQAPKTAVPETEPQGTTAPETAAPDDEAALRLKELQSELEKLLYKGDDGYMHVTGSENIRIPATGVYLTFDNILTGSYFASEELKMTALNPGVPSYTGTDSPHSYYFEDDRLCISYNNGETVFRLPDSLKTDVTGTEPQSYYISEHIAWFAFRISPVDPQITVTVWDKGERVTTETRRWQDMAPLYLCYLSDTTGIGLSRVYPAAGMRFIKTFVSQDSGASFTELVMTDDVHPYGASYGEFNENLVRTGNEAIRFGDRVYFTGTYLKYGGWKYIEKLIEENGLPLTVKDIILPDEEELLSGLYGYGKQCLLPYFDGEIGIVAYLLRDTRDHDNVKNYYRYYLSLDAGENWIPYDPGIPDSERTIVELTYTTQPEPR